VTTAIADTASIGVSQPRFDVRPATALTSTGPFHFLIGVVPVSVTSAYLPAMRDFRSLYADCEIPAPLADSINIEVLPVRIGRLKRKRYEIRGDGEHRFTLWYNRSVLPHIEWTINWQIMLYLPRLYAIHAAVLEVDGAGVIFPAEPGSGKTTLSAAMVHSGWRYLSDEFALIDPDTLRLQPYPKALCVKEGSYPILDQLGLRTKRRRDYDKGRKGKVTFVRPAELSSDPIGDACPVKHIVFCHYDGRAKPSIEPISRAEAVLRLNEQSFNFHKFRAKGIGILAEVVRGAKCYELWSGPIRETCDLLRSTVGANA
jgi:HprK-related kinase A